MLEFLYDSWEWIVVIGSIITFFSAVIAIWKFILIDKDSDKIHSKFSMIIGTSIAVVSCSFVIVSALAFMLCTKVPSLEGKNVVEAEELLNKAGLKIEYENNIPYNKENEVIQQFQGVGEVILKSSPIGVIVEEAEKTKETVDVPNVIGEKYEDAIALLKRKNLQYRARITDESDALPSQYYICYQSFSAGSSIPEGTVIDLELSLEEVDVSSVQNPSDLITVPNLIGMEEREAVDSLLSSGLKGSVYWLQGNDENADFYYILNQSIPEGSLVRTGTVIELERSPKQPGMPIEVPNVIGMEQNEATHLLMQNGLQFQVWWVVEENEMPSDVYYIIGQSVKSGDVVPAGTLVKLELTTKNPNS